MRVYGLDFTSAPSSARSKAKKLKQLMLAICNYSQDRLTLESFVPLNRKMGNFAGVEEWLAGEGEWTEKEQNWIAGIDFPFGQPTELVRSLGWPKSWLGYVQHVKALGKVGFETKLKEYKKGAADGKRHLYRKIDKQTGAQSPMTLDYTPVGKMFFQGAPILCASGICVVPMQMNDCNKVVVEAYPKIVAFKWIKKRSYKNDDPKKDTETQSAARKELVQAIRGLKGQKAGKSFREWFGFELLMDDALAEECIDDFSGDKLDSVLCAVQAAWAYSFGKANNYGVPKTADSQEGWICDPETCS